VINPDTPVEAILHLLPFFDLVLIMTVHPGFSGQGFLGENLEKVKRLRASESELRAKGELTRDLDIQVDGGIDVSTARLALQAGANVFVAGSAILGRPSPASALREMRQSLKSICTGTQGT
jgi:ribulose-phosphate 3-epimerase